MRSRSTESAPSSTILLFAPHAAALQELLVLAKDMTLDGALHPLLVVSQLGQVPPRAVSDVDVWSFRKHCFLSWVIQRASGKYAKYAKTGILARSYPGLAIGAAVQIVALWAVRGAMGRLLRRTCARAVLLTGDRGLGLEAGLIWAARRSRCAVILVPFAFSGGSDDIAIGRRENPLHRCDTPPLTGVKRLISKTHPDQVRNTIYGPMLFYPPSTTLALAALRMLAPNPWCMGGGFSDAVAVFGGQDLEQYVSCGIPREKLAITGQPSLDELHSTWKARGRLKADLVAQYGLDEDRPIVVFAAPHHGEKAIGAYWEDVGFILTKLVETEWNTLVSLHPKSDRRQYERLVSGANANLLAQPLSEALPAADLFVVGQSSTVRWAALMGIPTIIVDFGWYNYSYFDRLPNVAKANDRDDLVRLLRERVDRRAGGASCKPGAARHTVGDIAPFDGGACPRIIRLVKDLANDRGNDR